MLFLFFSVIFSSCYNNNIYYDMEQQAIKTCNGRVIKQLYVVNEDENIFYHFSKLDGKEGVNSFTLKGLNEQYQLENLNKEITLSEFKLVPEMKYKISNSSYGDAASSSIEIRIDQNGLVGYASKTTCD